MRSKVFLVAYLLVFGGSCCSFAVAQQEQSVQSESSPQTTGKWPTPEEAVARMSSKLNLSDDQKNKITPIIANRQAQMKALMADTSGRRMQKARKAKSIMSDSDKKIEAVLTSDQKNTYEQLKEDRREQMRSRMQ